jgi:hypothetical protein
MFHPSVSDGLDGGPIKDPSSHPLFKPLKVVDKTGNQINTIYPYKTKSGWAFDDEEVGLKAEPFIAGIPQIINSLVGKKKSFTAHISHSKIPKATGHLVKMSLDEVKFEELDEIDGWYKLEGTDMIGWLCPATLKYFKDYPDDIYFKIE